MRAWVLAVVVGLAVGRDGPACRFVPSSFCNRSRILHICPARCRPFRDTGGNSEPKTTINRARTKDGYVPKLSKSHYFPYSKTVPPPSPCGRGPKFEPCVETPEANRRFQECCSGQDLPDPCVKLCLYDISVTTVSMMRRLKLGRALSSGASGCPVTALGPILQCAGPDTEECCEARGVFAGTGKLCLPFCVPPLLTSIGPHQLRCAAQVESILGCHQSTLRPSIKRPTVSKLGPRKLGPPPSKTRAAERRFILRRRSLVLRRRNARFRFPQRDAIRRFFPRQSRAPF